MVTEFLYIKDDVPVFVTWLALHVDSAIVRRFPTNRGYIILNGFSLPWPTTQPTHAINFIELAGRLVPVDDDGQEGAPVETNWLIRFDISGRETLEVKAECQESAVMGFFNELVQAARLRWPQPGTTGADTAGAVPDAPALPDVKTMRDIWRPYSPETALIIAESLPGIYAKCDDPVKWGPTFVERHSTFKRATISRYFSAWRKAKRTEINGTPLHKDYITNK